MGTHARRVSYWTHVEAKLFREVYAASLFADATSVGQLKIRVSFLLTGRQAITAVSYKNIRDLPARNMT